ncbi:SIMPL domain-containing protein [Aliiglaciecola litoralis]|uniref:DUF541 domain-containing protein n=1 Tax=Aliiglaciecola litoralis TaxID=582857 RepID=A0ABN1LCW3_9ALTE
MKFFSTLLITLCLSNITLAHESRSDTITVNGQGSISKAPDILKFTITVEERGQDTKKLSESVNRKTDQIHSVLHDHGVVSKDIQSMAISLYPWFERERQSNVQKGFVFSRNLDVTLRAFSSYPAIMNDLFTLNISRIDGLRYEVEDQQAAYLAALKAAMDDAKMRAQHIAAGLNLKLGEVANVEENSAYNPTPQPSARNMAVFSDSAEYLPGLNEINARIVVTFKIAE